MSAWLLAHEPAFRLGVFLTLFVSVAGWEVVAPRRQLVLAKGRRWLANMGLVVFNTVAVRLLVPTAAIGAAVFSAEHGWGLLNLIELPEWAEVVLAVVLLDLAIYLQHVMFHAVPLLWRLHMVHHTDLDYDLTTGSRFHTIEILLSMGIKLALVALLGPPAVAVLLFEVLLSGAATFNHGNIRLPLSVDRVLRWFLVTPDMHRVHHSVVPRETNSNFGFNIPWWDRIFGTYQDQPSSGHDGIQIGIDPVQERRPQSLLWMLLLPFRGVPGAYSIRGRDYE